MATRTTNYGLYKPDPTDDYVDFLSEFNDNMDEIDENLGGGGGSSTLAGLSDVNFSSLTAGDLLIYDGAEWINHSFTEGHTILDESGSAVTARDNLQFTDGLKVTDDSGNNKTKVGVDTAFTEAVTRTNIDSGDSFSTILGKIKKFFTDLKTVAFTGSYNDLTNKPTIPVGSDYVQKSGDTMTGALTINRAADVQAVFSRNHTGTSSAVTSIDVGNNVADGTAGSTYGRIRLFGKRAYRTNIYASASTGNRDIEFPNKSGTVALTSDIPDISGKVNKSGDTMSGNLSIGNEGNESVLTLGTNQPALTPQASSGKIEFWIAPLNTAYKTSLSSSWNTANRNIYFPDKSGILALTSDLGNMINDADHKKERTGAGSITFNSSLKGHLAFVWIQAQANNYWWLGGNAIILGSHPFAYMFITGAGIDAYISLGFGTNPDVTLQWVNQDGNDVTSTSKMVVWVM